MAEADANAAELVEEIRGFGQRGSELEVGRAVKVPSYSGSSDYDCEGTITRERDGESKSKWIPRPCLIVVLFVQPGKIGGASNQSTQGRYYIRTTDYSTVRPTVHAVRLRATW